MPSGDPHSSVTVLCCGEGFMACEGPEVSGPSDALLLAIGGRRAELAFLEGQGLPVRTQRMPPPE